MKIALVDVSPDKGFVNKDLAAGFGTNPRIGKSIRGRILEFLRSQEEFPAMSFAYIAAILTEKGHQVEYLKDQVPDKADVVVMLPAMATYKKELGYLKKAKEKGAFTIAVGVLVSTKPELFKKDADLVVIGEPEGFFTKMNAKLPNGVVKAKIADLDSLPFPKWDLFNYKSFSFSPVMSEKPFSFVLSSRGCPYTCYYCPYRLHQFMARSPKNVVDEIEHLVEKYKIKGFMFRDATFTFDRKRTEEIAKSIIKRGLKVKWVCETRLDLLDEKLIDLLYAAGLRVLKTGVETVDLELMKRMKRKPIEIDHQERIIKYCDKKGIKVVAFYIIGLPNDTKENILNTIKYAKKLNTYGAQFTVCTPFPGTEFYEEIKGSIDEDWDKFDSFTPVFKHQNLSKPEIEKLKEKAFLDYYSNPRYLIKFITRRMRK